ncbi:hypothetical protein ACFLW8_06180 [Chloroflexota bacterium]
MTNNEIVESYVEGITAACGLSINEAKTVIYYAVATHGISNINLMPMLILRGPQSTGKSTIIEILKQIVNKPNIIDGKVSPAVLRDKLGYETTALIEEADSIDEGLLIRRYSRQTSNTVVKRGGAMKGFQNEQLDIFGATVLHRRVPFRDAALDTRSIIITTRYKTGGYYMPIFTASNLIEIENSVDWDKPLGLPDGRVSDVWRPLMYGAITCDEKGWLVYALEEILRGKKRLEAGQKYEPEYAVIFSLQTLFGEKLINNISQPLRISDVKPHLKEQFDIKLLNYQIEEMVRNLGFKVTRPRGYSTIQPDATLLFHLVGKIQTEV